MIYQIQLLNKNLVFIQWHAFPDEKQALQYIQDIQGMLDEAEQPLYFLSDLRKGYIIQAHIIRKLSQFTQHPKFGGATSISRNNAINPILRLWKLFSSNKNTSDTWTNLEDAVQYLETLKPGLMQGIDWQEVMNEPASR